MNEKLMQWYLVHTTNAYTVGYARGSGYSEVECVRTAMATAMHSTLLGKEVLHTAALTHENPFEMLKTSRCETLEKLCDPKHSSRFFDCNVLEVCGGWTDEKTLKAFKDAGLVVEEKVDYGIRKNFLAEPKK